MIERNGRTEHAAPTHASPGVSATDPHVLKPMVRPESIYVLGDSHVLPYHMRLYASDGIPPVVFHALYSPGFAAELLVGTHGELAPAIADPLRRGGLLVDVDGRAVALHRTHDAHWRHCCELAGRAQTSPAIVLSVGGLDAMNFGAGPSDVDDIVLPETVVPRTGPLAAAPLPGAVPFDEAVRGLAEFMEPVAQAIRDLEWHGFRRLALLSVVPPTSRDSAYRAARTSLRLSVNQSNVTTAWRYKLIMVANEVLRRVAAETGIAFIDRWNDQVQDSLALPGLLNDWVHLSDWGTDASALAIIKHFRGTPIASEGPPAYYQVYVEDPGAPNSVREHTVTEETFAAVKEAQGDAFVALHDVNEMTTNWVNRARIVRAVRL